MTQPLLAQFERPTEQLTEREICNELLALRNQDSESLGEQERTELDAEILAFDFREKEPCRERDEANFFLPASTFTDANGRPVTNPDRADVTPDVHNYWAGRATSTDNPILAFRYAGLVWEFAKEVTGSSADIRYARLLIDSAARIAREKLHRQETSIISKLGFALSVAQSIRDRDRIQMLCHVIVDYECDIAELNKPGLWGFAFNYLVEDKRVQPPDSLVQRIIADLEGKLKAIQEEAGKDFNPFSADAAAQRLARYYRRSGKPDEVKRVLNVYRDTYLQAADETSALVGSAWLQKVYGVLLPFGLRSEAEEVSIKLRELGRKGRDELAHVSHDMEIPAEEFDKFLDGMVAGDVETALTRFVDHFIPIRDQVERQVKELAESHPLLSIFGTTLVDGDGRPKANVGSVEHDLDGNIAKLTAQNMGFTAIFVRRTVEKLREKFELTSDDLMAFLYRSPILPSDRRSIVSEGLTAYLEENWSVAMHLLIPQIEATLRRLIELSGGATWKLGRNGAFMLKNFEDLLRDERAARALGADAVHYLRVLFTDQRGWNLRNAVCHGIVPETAFCAPHADRVVHALLFFALIREGAAPSDPI